MSFSNTRFCKNKFAKLEFYQTKKAHRHCCKKGTFYLKCQMSRQRLFEVFWEVFFSDFGGKSDECW